MKIEQPLKRALKSEIAICSSFVLLGISACFSFNSLAFALPLSIVIPFAAASIQSYKNLKSQKKPHINPFSEYLYKAYFTQWMKRYLKSSKSLTEKKYKTNANNGIDA